nr:MAG TPA: Putative virion structural protein [Caudoviricetes sp.]
MTSQETIFDLIKKANPDAELDTAKVTLGEPVVSTGAYNTEITVVAVKNLGYANKQTFQYNRIDAGLYFLNVLPKLLVETATTTADLLPVINEQYGLTLTEDDVWVEQVGELPLDGSAIEHGIFFRPECLTWVGGFTVRVARKPTVETPPAKPSRAKKK